MQDYYTVLGVPRNASHEDIRKAYKKQSMKHHPDRGGDEEQFKKINEAYQVLSNSDKRSAYDNPNDFNFNTSNMRGQNPFGGGNGWPPGFEDIFAASGFRQQRGNRDINLEVKISLAEVITGKNMVITYMTAQGEKSVDIDIPAGARHHDQVRFSGLGETTNPRFPPGNLNVRINIARDREWQRDGDNLIIEKSVNTLDLILGCAIIINTLDGKSLNLQIPQGTNPGTVLNIREHGVPNLNTGRKGNILVKIKGATPKTDNKKLLNQLKDIKDKM